MFSLNFNSTEMLFAIFDVACFAFDWFDPRLMTKARIMELIADSALAISCVFYIFGLGTLADSISWASIIFMLYGFYINYKYRKANQLP